MSSPINNAAVTVTIFSSCSACGHPTKDNSNLILYCPATDPLRSSFFGDSLSLYDLWSGSWRVDRGSSGAASSSIIPPSLGRGWVTTTGYEGRLQNILEPLKLLRNLTKHCKFMQRSTNFTSYRSKKNNQDDWPCCVYSWNRTGDPIQNERLNSYCFVFALSRLACYLFICVCVCAFKNS